MAMTGLRRRLPRGVEEHEPPAARLAVDLRLDRCATGDECGVAQRSTRSSPQPRAMATWRVYSYPGAEHGFFTKGRPTFNAEAVAAASVHIERLLSTLT